MPTERELRERRRDQRDRGAVTDAASLPLEVLEDLADGDVGNAAAEVAKAPFRVARKLLTFDWF